MHLHIFTKKQVVGQDRRFSELYNRLTNICKVIASSNIKVDIQDPVKDK